MRRVAPKVIDSGDARVPRTALTPCSAPGIPIAPTWVVTMFGGFAVLLVPWLVWLSLTLPPAQRAAHLRLAWMGFDAALIALMAGIAITALRDSPLLERVATAAGALLIIDAWFDVTMSNGRDQGLEAMLLAVAVELPLAGLCLWIASHAGAVRDRCAELLNKRSARSA